MRSRLGATLAVATLPHASSRAVPSWGGAHSPIGKATFAHRTLAGGAYLRPLPLLALGQGVPLSTGVVERAE